MDADLERTLPVQSSTELAGGGRVTLVELATATGLDIDDVTAAVEEPAAQNLLESEPWSGSPTQAWPRSRPSG